MQLYVNLQLSQNKNLYSFLKRDIQIWRLQNPRTVFTPTVPSKEQTEVTGGVCKVDLSLLFLQQLPTSWSDVCNLNSTTRAGALGRWRAPDMALGLYLYLIHPLSHSLTHINIHMSYFIWTTTPIRIKTILKKNTDVRTFQVLQLPGRHRKEVISSEKVYRNWLSLIFKPCAQQSLNRIKLISGVKCSFPDSSVGKESTCNAGDPSSIPGSGRSPGEGIDNPLQYSWASLVV